MASSLLAGALLASELASITSLPWRHLLETRPKRSEPCVLSNATAAVQAWVPGPPV